MDGSLSDVTCLCFLIKSELISMRYIVNLQKRKYYIVYPRTCPIGITDQNIFKNWGHRLKSWWTKRLPFFLIYVGIDWTSSTVGMKICSESRLFWKMKERSYYAVDWKQLSKHSCNLCCWHINQPLARFVRGHPLAV